MSNRTWMFSGWQCGKAPSNEWIEETNQFLNHAFSIPCVTQIDVCYNNCMVFYKHNENKEKCDFCGANRYEEGQRSKVPRKVLRYLPITNRLQRLYAHKETAKLLQSHRPSTCSKIVHPCDGEAWVVLKRGQQSRLQVKFGPDKATPINTYAVMKSGMKAVDDNGSSGAIKSRKAQKRMDDYIAGVRRVAGRQENDQDDIEEEEQLHQHEHHLNEQGLYRDLGKEIPEEALQRLLSA